MTVTPRPYGRGVIVLDWLLPLRCVGCGRTGEPVCAGCAAGLSAPPALPVPPGLDAFHVAYAYDGLARHVVAQAKYRNAGAALDWCGDELRAVLDAAAAPTVALTWAPTTRAHRRQRGFDPAERIARRIGPTMAMLQRVTHATQTGHSRIERLQHAPRFRARRGVPPTVVVVDDVCTTGATLSAAAHALRKAGARTVIGAVFARTP